MRQKALHRFKLYIFLVLLLAGVTSAGLGISCQYSVETERITLGITPNQAFSLIYVAEEQHFFSKNGIDLIEKHYDNGALAADAMVKGEVDMAGSSEYPIVSKAFQKEKISAIASVDKYEGMYVVSLKSEGIQSLSDLKGRRVGLLRGGIVEFYLIRALDLKGIKKEEVTLADINPPQAAEGISSGSIDAAVVWQPFVYQLQTQLANQLVVLPIQSGQLGYVLMLSKNEWIERHPELVQRFLRSLAEAEDYSIQHPEQAKTIMKKHLKYDDAYIATIWPENQYSLSLEQTLIVAMKDEAQWIINNNLTDKRPSPISLITFMRMD